ncbi:cell envelope biogenesis protein TolA [Bradyrhizobium hipponense]|uniref:Cell envelope biogenesis protein TolA n=1 Tax=Bradyrhizobium hipponense TaxID=2605638 RepID=A0A5S4YSP2_9BRAD|nr:cell envelope biogenesis protein TolA [Bradyrhizobium hipponense]TYO67411.1 cell envelope biogenesis protein TolA [Bradyrhizobium hipponense]
MARKLKSYQTSLGFYDQAVAAPSMKAALEAWGAQSNLFHQGVARQTEDPEVVAATMAKPGVVLRRPVGSTGPFKEHPDLPTDLADSGVNERRSRSKPKRQAAPKVSERERGQAAAKFEREWKRQEAERRKEEAAQARERARRTNLGRAPLEVHLGPTPEVQPAPAPLDRPVVRTSWPSSPSRL